MIEQLDHWRLVNRQGMEIDTEELEAIELAAKTAYKVKECVTKVNDMDLNKTDKTGDHLGTWQGYKPSQVDAALTDIIEKHTSKLSEFALSVKYFGAKGDGLTDDTEAIQTGIDYVATHNKSLFFPSGVYLISSTLVLPQETSKWGIELSGLKSETKYQYLASSNSTVIKAIAPMTAMITNRGANPSVNVAYYNVVKNLVLDGNNFAQRGYINGWQDKILNCTIARCTEYGISFGDLTNLTIMKECTLVLNHKGFECVGSDSTLWYMDNCTIRENISDGATISSSIGGVISNSVIESNGGKGIKLVGTNETLKRITKFKMNDCYFENNTDYAIEIDRTGTVSPSNIVFDCIYINSPSKAVNIIYGEDIEFNNPSFVGLPLSVGYFINNGERVIVKANESVLSPTNINITETKPIIRIMTKVSTPFGLKYDKIVQAKIYKPSEIVGITDNMRLSVEDATGTILTNRGQSTDITVMLPIPQGVGLSFKAICVTPTAHFWRFLTDYACMLIDGSTTPKVWVQTTTAEIGSSIEFTSVAIDGIGFAWVVNSVTGTWSTY